MGAAALGWPATGWSDARLRPASLAAAGAELQADRRGGALGVCEAQSRDACSRGASVSGRVGRKAFASRGAAAAGAGAHPRWHKGQQACAPAGSAGSGLGEAGCKPPATALQTCSASPMPCHPPPASRKAVGSRVISTMESSANHLAHGIDRYCIAKNYRLRPVLTPDARGLKADGRRCRPGPARPRESGSAIDRARDSMT